jgi:predicted Ser/Thr protein kinase
VTVVADRYRLLTRLGQGGMGVVWRAYDELLRRDVAVKELHVRVGVDGDYQAQQILREARAAARLRHAGVVAVHDVVVDDGRPLIVMELIEGPSLAELIRTEGPLSEQRVAEIGVRVLAALSVAHAQGVVHRDIKPANILLDGDRVVLTDFGIAAVSSDTTVSDAVLGSPEYLAPERVNGEPATPATDLWSLGVTLCAALRGESPFQRSDTQATLAAVLTYELPRLPQAPRLWPVLAALLDRDPRRRPAAEQAASMLARVSGTAEPEELTRPVREQAVGAGRGPRTRRRLAVLFVVLVLAGATTLFVVLRPGGEGERTGSPGTSTSPTVSAPAGFTGHRGDGFTIATPEGWFKDASGQDIFWVEDPHGAQTVLAHLEWWDQGDRGGALGVLRGFEQGEFTMDFITNYRKLRLEERPAPRGFTGAEMEVSYHVSDQGELDLHELMHVVTGNGRTYILTLAAQSDDPAETEKLWKDNLDDLVAIRDSFRVVA